MHKYLRKFLIPIIRFVSFFMFIYVIYYFSFLLYQEFTKLEHRTPAQALVLEKKVHVNEYFKGISFCPEMIGLVLYKSYEYKAKVDVDAGSCRPFEWDASQKLNPYKIGQTIDVLISNENRFDVVVSDYSIWNLKTYIHIGLLLIAFWGVWVVITTDYQKWYRDHNIWQD